MNARNGAIRFWVDGKAQPAGSKRAVPGGDGRARVIDANKLARPYKALVLDAAREAYDGPLLEGPVALELIEYRLRPKGHEAKYGLSKKGRETPFPTSKPDLLKVARGIEDALTGMIYRDDSQIVYESLSKRWGERPGVSVTVRRIQRLVP